MQNKTKQDGFSSNFDKRQNKGMKACNIGLMFMQIVLKSLNLFKNQFMRTFIFALFMGLYSLANAQSYFDSTLTYITLGEGLGSVFWSHKYRMVLDSIVSDTEYYKMEDNLYGVKSSNDCSFKYIKGKIFYQYHGFDKGPQLYYDFNLKEGDTMRLGDVGSSMVFPNSLLTVDSIRQVQFAGKLRKGMYVHVGTLNLPFLWIEHIGSIENGVLYIKHWQMEAYNDLVNLCKSDTLLYWKAHDLIKSDANTCNPVFYKSSIQSSEFHGYKMFPNPFKDEVHFLDWDGHIVDLKIYGINGQVVFDAEVDTNMGLDLSKLAKGFYWVKMSNGQKVSTQMLVKE
jgi:hypothetical protein